MQHEQIATLTTAARLAVRWPEFFVVVLDDEVPVARAVSVPLAFPTSDRTELPDHGWDGIILWAIQDALDERPSTTLAGLDVQVAPDRRGQCIAGHALTALRACARDHGLDRLVVPVRPTGKQRLDTLAAYEREVADAPSDSGDR